MTALSSLIVNSSARSAAEIINRFGSALFWIVIVRKLGAGSLGSIAFALSLFSLFHILSTLGLGSMVIRDLASQRQRAGRYFTHLLLLGAAASVPLAGLMILAAHLIQPQPDTIYATGIMALALFPASGYYWSKTLLASGEKMKYAALTRTAENAVKLGLGLTLLFMGMGVREMICVIALSKGVAFALGFTFATRTIAVPELSYDPDTLRRLLRHSPAFASTTLCHALFWSMSVILITEFKGEVEAGWFSAAFKLVDLPLSLISSFSGALFPVASRVALTDPRLFTRLCVKSVKFMVLLSLAAAAGGTVFAPALILLLYGPALQPAAPVFAILIWLLVPYSLVPVMAYSLVNHHMQNYDLLANACAVFCLLVLSLILVPGWGWIGASVSLVLGTWIFAACETFWVSKKVYSLQLSAASLRPLFAAAAMVLVLYSTRNYHPYVTLPLGAAAYTLILWLSKSVTEVDLAFVKQLRSIS